MMKLGSLFDGSGGFPLAGALCGIEPVWAAEVEPYPIAVTRSRFPNMKHLGDVSKVRGGEIEPVDIITFGSPCQDLSVAGKRAGLKHEDNGDDETTRSGLFMEAVRIIREMRAATNGVYPTFAIWENVPGAFTSNGGEDFRLVLEQLIRIIEPNAVMPSVPKAGWAYADSYTGDGWSLAYRILDAQHIRTAQRRRRVFLVLDLRGGRAGEVLFEREGLRGYFEAGRTPWQGIAADAQDSSGADDRAGAGFDGYNGDLTGDVSSTLGVNCGTSTGRNGVLIPSDSGYPDGLLPFAQNQRDEVRDLGDKAGALQAQPGMKQQTFIVDSIGGQAERGWEGDVAPTLKATHYKSAPCVTVYSSVVAEKQPVYCLQGNGIDRADTAGCNGKGVKEDVSYTLNTVDRPAVAFQTYQKKAGPLMANSHPGSYTGQDAFNDMLVAGMDCRNGRLNGDLSGTLQAKPNGGFSYNVTHPVLIKNQLQHIVRRLTPTECARLQGFPDRWGDIDQKDSFTDEEYQFWMDVRNTHAAINGKQPKDYTVEQMLAWYGKLHTDSAEYKMWGNGIALPCALFVMQGIQDALEMEEKP